MLGQALETILNTHEGKSGFRLLTDNAEAFISRIALCELAKNTLDIQYYIYHDDASGQIFSHKIIEAADRGVRVRILVDDIDMGNRDASFKLFDAHPNITIRIFNPLINRAYFRTLELIFNLNRAGRRMHNKTFIADNMIAIIGGRNIGDEYFDARNQTHFVDLDLLVIGPVVKDAVQSFRDFWLSHWAIPIDKLRKIRVVSDHVTSMRKRLKDKWSQSKNRAYFKTLRHSHFVNQLINDELVYVWASAQLFYDVPAKLLNHENSATAHFGPTVSSIINQTTDNIYITSPYFVPGEAGLKMVKTLTAKGVTINILTNSLASTDVVAVHSGYKRYRKRLLQCKVNLYEYKSTANSISLLSKFRRGQQKSSLHAKYIISDNQYLLIGSSNLDPRSANLNTEIGIVIQSKDLALQTIEIFKRATSVENSYQLSLRDNKNLIWQCGDTSAEQQCDAEPDVGLWKKVLVTLIGLLPVESLL